MMECYQVLLLSFLILHLSVASSTRHMCSTDQSIALLRFSRSVSIINNSGCWILGVTSFPRTNSWRESTDCCTWDSVTCNNATGNVNELDLSCSQLRGLILPNSSLFSLSHLTRLNLSGNDFSGSALSPKFGRFSSMTHLDLSFAGFIGPVPLEISFLAKLTSLDLSVTALTFDNSSLARLLQNLTVLRELFLDDIGLSMIKQSSWMNMSSALTSLSLQSCRLTGTFPEYIFSLPNLQAISLQQNQDLAGTLPKFNWTSPLILMDLSFTSFSGDLPYSIGNLKYLEILNLERCKFTNSIPPSLGILTSLTSLKLISNQFTGRMPLSLGNLEHLTGMYLSFINFTGNVDHEVFTRLYHLEELVLSGLSVNVDGDKNYTFPSLGSLSSQNCSLCEFPNISSTLYRELTTVDLSHSMIHGEIPGWLWEAGRESLLSIDLSDGILTRGIPRQIPLRKPDVIAIVHNLLQGQIPAPPPSTTMFYTAGNEFSGEIPSLICNASSLLIPTLSENILTSSVPQCLANLTGLGWLAFNDNKLEGLLPLPRSLGRLYAWGNNFLGEIPSSVCDLKFLGEMVLSDFFFNGRIPECLGNISSLFGLGLRNNQLEGPLPPSLVNRTCLISVDIGHNMINDTFPFWMESLPTLQSLKLDSNKLHGPLDKFVSKFSIPCLSEINHGHNDLSGHLSTMPFISARQVDLSNNKFDRSVPIPGARTLLYSLSNIMFAGGVPSMICNASNLEVLNMSDNSLSGIIPNCLTSSNTSLSVLNLCMNYFQGELPEILGGNSSLRTLDFSRNRLESPVPQSLSNCQMLEVLDLSYNTIVDTFPSWLGRLPKPQVLVLKLNKFHGSVQSPDAKDSFPKLQILDLSSNHFSGHVSSEFIECSRAMMAVDANQSSPQYVGDDLYKDSVTVTIKGSEIVLEKIIMTFTTIDLSNNNFQMEIPDAIGKLISLRGLNLSGNNITGHIPKLIGNLANLEWLDLSTNSLSGTIPGELKDLTALSFLNSSGNQLSFPIPQGNQFNTFNNDSFAEDSEHTNIFDWKIILMGYGCGLIGGLSMGYIVFQTKRPEWFVGMLRGEVLRKDEEAMEEDPS
ncbi:hypothetical protein BT93_G0374 [Corymbia citriodora subsp. variegata]|nr:hypothetical protein BT93_G0374 [Corymbia citriodora subsp. variegata]